MWHRFLRAQSNWHGDSGREFRSSTAARHLRIDLVRRLHGVALLALCCAVPGAAQAQEYPSKSIHFIVPFPAGGGVDILARAIGQKMTESWNVPVIIDDRPGAGGNIGTALAAKAPADGYTIVLGTIGTHAVNASLYKKLPYDPVRDFGPVILVGWQR